MLRGGLYLVFYPREAMFSRLVAARQNVAPSDTEQQLVLRHCCYWDYIKGEPTSNLSTKRIRVPRKQVFTPEVIDNLFERLRHGRL
jgi:hypothetical protein